MEETKKLTAKEILDMKEVFNVFDIMTLFQCGKNRAYKVINEIKSVSNKINISGRVHKLDYYAFVGR